MIAYVYTATKHLFELWRLFYLDQVIYLEENEKDVFDKCAQVWRASTCLHFGIKFCICISLWILCHSSNARALASSHLWSCRFLFLLVYAMHRWISFVYITLHSWEVCCFFFYSYALWVLFVRINFFFDLCEQPDTLRQKESTAILESEADATNDYRKNFCLCFPCAFFFSRFCSCLLFLSFGCFRISSLVLCLEKQPVWKGNPMNFNFIAKLIERGNRNEERTPEIYWK